MRTSFFLIILACFISSCSRSPGIERENDRVERKFRKNVLKIAEVYVKSNLSDAKKTETEDGLTTIGDDQKTYVIDPSKIFIGHINPDTINDAIISLSPFQGNFEVITEHLIIINTDGKLKLLRSLDSDMRILSIVDGIITAEVPEHSRNTPLFNCPSCWEVVKFQFREGELVRME
ncbi:MAG: hypothetical protein NTW82_09565 [Bacteroidia bacterium]|nr:hypothetical protein [Bacteroidia bacterium]